MKSFDNSESLRRCRHHLDKALVEAYRNEMVSKRGGKMTQQAVKEFQLTYGQKLELVISQFASEFAAEREGMQTAYPSTIDQQHQP